MGIRLEDVTPARRSPGSPATAPVTVVAATWIGGNALRLTYRTDDGRLDERILYRDHEPRLDPGQARPRTTLRPTRPASSWPPRRCASGWRAASTRCWRSTPATWSRSPTRSRRSTASCWTGPRCGSCWPTTPARARRSWPGCTSRSSCSAATWNAAWSSRPAAWSSSGRTSCGRSSA